MTVSQPLVGFILSSLRESVAFSSNVNVFAGYSANCLWFAGVDTVVILEACVYLGLLPVPRYPRSIDDPLDRDIVSSMLLPECNSNPSWVPMESICMSDSSDLRSRASH